MRAYKLLKAPDQGGDEQAGHAPMQAVCHAAVIAFAEFITKIWIRNGITETCQIFSIVARDVAIMECDDLAMVSGQYIAEGGPTAPSLALQSDIEVVVDQELEDGLDPRAIIPDEAHSLRERGKVVFRHAKF